MTDTTKGAPPTQPVMAWPALQIGTTPTASEIALPLEEPLEIAINGQRVTTLMRLPGHERELAVGFCISEGLIRAFGAIHIVQHCGQAGQSAAPPSTGELSRNRVLIQARPDGVHLDALYEVARLIRSGCGATGRTDLVGSGLSAVKSELSVSADLLLRAKRALRQAQRVHGHTGGVHTAAIFDDRGSLVVAREDIGRHNAVDKALGHCLMGDVALKNKLLVSTGRASYEMVAKAIRLGIPIMATVSACTSLAAQLAEEYNLTLVGYLRGERMTIYTCPERVVGAAPS